MEIFLHACISYSLSQIFLNNDNGSTECNISETWWILPLMQTPEGGKRLFCGHVEVEKVNGVLPVGLWASHTQNYE